MIIREQIRNTDKILQFMWIIYSRWNSIYIYKKNLTDLREWNKCSVIYLSILCAQKLGYLIVEKKNVYKNNNNNNNNRKNLNREVSKL